MTIKPQKVRCPYCGQTVKLVTMPHWRTVPGYPQALKRGGSGPYAHVPVPGFQHTERQIGRCSGRLVIGKWTVMVQEQFRVVTTDEYAAADDTKLSLEIAEKRKAIRWA